MDSRTTTGAVPCGLPRPRRASDGAAPPAGRIRGAHAPRAPTGAGSLQEIAGALFAPTCTSGTEIAAKFQGTLTATQQEAAGALLAHDTGVLVAPPGAGKIVVGIYLVAQRGRTLDPDQSAPVPRSVEVEVAAVDVPQVDIKHIAQKCAHAGKTRTRCASAPGRCIACMRVRLGCELPCDRVAVPREPEPGLGFERPSVLPWRRWSTGPRSAGTRTARPRSSSREARRRGQRTRTRPRRAPAGPAHRHRAESPAGHPALDLAVVEPVAAKAIASAPSVQPPVRHAGPRPDQADRRSRVAAVLSGGNVSLDQQRGLSWN